MSPALAHLSAPDRLYILTVLLNTVVGVRRPVCVTWYVVAATTRWVRWMHKKSSDARDRRWRRVGCIMMMTAELFGSIMGNSWLGCAGLRSRS